MPYDDAYVDALTKQLDDSQNKNTSMSQALSASSYQANQAPNLIELQLDCANMLEKIEHFLKSDYIITDPNTGAQIWAEQTENAKKLFNTFGVNSLMSIYSIYITPNTFLSFYEDITRIYEILADLGDEINNYVFCNYEKLGLDTEYKKTRYGLAILSTLHFIENAYRRALMGDTAKRVNSANINVNPGQQHGVSSYNMASQPKKSWSLSNILSRI